jgi:nucleotide-binding universal stress UspA family protein
MLRKILIGLDGSPYSENCIAAGIELAKTYDAALAGLAIVDEPGIEHHLAGAPAGAIHYAEKEKQDKLEDARKKSKQFLDNFKSLCEKQSVRYELLLHTGSPFRIIIEESKTVDLAVIGIKTFYHYETQVTSGETLKRVLDETATPVLALPQKAELPKNVLLTYDGSVQASKAIRMRVHLTKKLSVNYTILNVNEDMEEGQVLVERLAKYLRYHDIDSETLVLPGHPGKVILETARKLQPVHVVLGAYSHSSLREWLMGSTADALIKDGTIPLFIYH